jgi:hypothetical protein
MMMGLHRVDLMMRNRVGGDDGLRLDGQWARRVLGMHGLFACLCDAFVVYAILECVSIWCVNPTLVLVLKSVNFGALA